MAYQTTSSAGDDSKPKAAELDFRDTGHFYHGKQTVPLHPSAFMQSMHQVYTPEDDQGQRYWQPTGSQHGAQIVPQGISEMTDLRLEALDAQLHSGANNVNKRRRVAPRSGLVAGADIFRDVERGNMPRFNAVPTFDRSGRMPPTAGSHDAFMLMSRKLGSESMPPHLRMMVQHEGIPQQKLKHIDNVLTILEQPTERGRFRYAKERRRTPLNGRKEGAFPIVALQDDWVGRIPDGTIIYATVVTRHDDSDGIPIPHWHALEGKSGESASQTLVQGKATFSNLVVVRNERTAADRINPNIKSAEDHQVIRIMFQMCFEVAETKELCRTHIVSEPIYGTELKIHNVSHRIIATETDTEVIFLTSKIKKQNTALKLTDLNPSGDWKPAPTSDDGAGWHLDDQKRPTFLLQPLYVHHQYALVAKLPPFYIPGLQNKKKVEVKLVDHVQGMESNSVEFEYSPQPTLLEMTVPPTPVSATTGITAPISVTEEKKSEQ